MVRGWSLSDQERDRLDSLRLRTDHKDVFRNGTIILMTANGQSKFTIAGTLGCSASTVDRLRGLYRDKGLAGLQPIKPPGRPAKATAQFRRLCERPLSATPDPSAMPSPSGRPLGSMLI